MGNLFQELTRRNVFRVGAGYIVLSWLILQVGAVLAPILGLPDTVLSFVLFALVLGFPLALLFAWAYELTPEGLKRSGDVMPEASVMSATGRRLNMATSMALALIVVVLLTDKFFFSNPELTLEGDDNAPPGVGPYDSIAVLPFVNMSGEPDQEFFSDGISEELLNLLARTKGLRVAARTSSFAFKNMNKDISEIGEKLKVETVLEGSVRKAGTNLRITAQLIDVASGYHMWSQNYDREMTDIFKVQDEISAAIVSALAVHFGGEIQIAATSQGGNVEAYEEYLRGRESIGLRTKESIEQAAVHFDRAIEIDPGFAPAWGGKADTFLLLSDSPVAYGDIPQKYAYEFAGTLIVKALNLDPELADAYNSRAFILAKKGRHKEAMKDFNRALELRPNFATALMWQSGVLSDTRRWKEAHEALEKAHRIDPLSLVIIQNLAQSRAYYGDVKGVDALAYQIRLIAPENLVHQWTVGALAREAEGDISEAYRLRKQAIEEQDIARYRVDFSISAFDLKNFAEAERFATPQKRISNLLLRGEVSQARQELSDMEQSWQASSVGIWFRVNIEMWAGNYREANELIDTLLPDLDLAPDGPLFKDSFEVFERVVSYIRIKREIGDDEAASRALSSIEDFLRICREAEIFFSCHQLDAARLTFEDDFDGAVAAIEKALQSHNLNWGARNNPVFDVLADRADFQAVFDRFDEYINKERAELGWAPMEGLE